MKEIKKKKNKNMQALGGEEGGSYEKRKKLLFVC